jgi:uncharacterized membrane protein YtjA (UPF0391 family)
LIPGNAKNEDEQLGRNCINMLRWAFILLFFAIIAGIFGFTGLAGASTDVARTLFFVFLILMVLTALIGAFKGDRLR